MKNFNYIILIILFLFYCSYIHGQSYNPEAAATYSDLWTCDIEDQGCDQYLHNPAYNYYSGNVDCANFVSQCLIAGGLILTEGIDHTLPQGTQTGQGYNGVDDWGCIPYCDNLHLHLVNYQDVEYERNNDPDEPNWMIKGDAAIFGNPSDYWEHAVFAAVGDQSTTTLYNAHTNNRYHRAVTFFYSSTWPSCDFYHINITVCISGFVKDNNGNGIEDVTITFKDEYDNVIGVETTQSDGYYSHIVENETSGSITPDKEGYTFMPSSISYSNIEVDLTDQNFTGTLIPPLNADFEANPTSITAGGTVQFADLSTNATSWDWDFGDGNTSFQPYPSHTYFLPGDYSVTLSVSDGTNTDTETKPNYIHVSEQQDELYVDFSASSTSITVGESIDFTDQSTGNINSWSWTFDGGSPSTSSLQNPTITYDTYGIYDVSLTVSDVYGNTDTKTKTNYITVYSETSLSVDFDYYFISNENIHVMNPPSVTGNTLLYFEENASIATKWTYYFSWLGGENTIVENFSVGGDGDIEWEAPYNINNPEFDLEVQLCIGTNEGDTACSEIKTIHITDPASENVDEPNYIPVNDCYITQVGNVYKIQDASSPYENVDNIKVWWDHGSGDGYVMYGNNPGEEVIAWDAGRIMSHVYNNIGHKTIKYRGLPPMGDLYNGAADTYYIWGGVIVIDCDLTSTYFPSPFSFGFTNAVRDDWAYENWGGPVYIYGGSFEFNGLANNYLAQKPTTISACNEIIINGDVEFVADGENELVLETNDDPCLQGGSKSAPIYPDNNKPEENNKESKWYCYPNPVKDKLNVSVLLKQEQNLHFKLLNAQGQVIAYHNRKNVFPGKYLFRFDVSNYQPGMYFISINLKDQNNTQKIIKQ